MIQAEITKAFLCDKEKLWNLITNNEVYSWRSDVSRIEIIDDEHFIEYDHHDFPTHFKITSKIKHQEYGFSLNNKNMQGSWRATWSLAPNGSIQLIFTETIEVKHAVMKLVAKSFLKKQQQTYMRDLENALKQ